MRSNGVNSVFIQISELPLIDEFLSLFGDISVNEARRRIHNLYLYRKSCLGDTDSTYTTFKTGNQRNNGLRNIDIEDMYDPLFEDEGLF